MLVCEAKKRLNDLLRPLQESVCHSVDALDVVKVVLELAEIGGDEADEKVVALGLDPTGGEDEDVDEVGGALIGDDRGVGALGPDDFGRDNRGGQGDHSCV